MHRNDFDTFDELVRGKLAGYTEPPEMESLTRIHAKKARVASLYQLYRLFAVLLVAGLGMFASTLFVQQTSEVETSSNTSTQPSTEMVQPISTAEFASAVSVNTHVSTSAPDAISSLSSGSDGASSVTVQPGSSNTGTTVSATRNNLRSTTPASSVQSKTNRTSNKTTLPANKSAATSSSNRTSATPSSNNIKAPAVVTHPSTEKQSTESQLPSSKTTIQSDSVSKAEPRKDGTCEVAFNYYGSYTGALTFYASLPTASNNELLWDFGDGHTSTESSPTHKYEQPGTYNVSLVLTNGKQCRAQANHEIVLNAPAEPRKSLTLSGSLLAGNDIVSNGVIEVYELNTRTSKYMSTMTVKTQNDGSFTLPLNEGVQYLIKGYPTSAYPNYQPTFWGNTTSDDDATEIVITQGERLDLLGYNIKLLANEQTLPELTPVQLPIARTDNQVILVDANNNVIGMGHVDQNGNIVANEGTKAGNYMAVNPSTGKTSPVQVSSSGAVAASGTGSTIPTQSEKVSVFPNPVNDMVNFGVNSDEREEAILVIMNAAGYELIRKSIVFTAGFNLLQYDISEFSPGIYYVMVIKGGQQVLSNRIVKAGTLSK